MIWYLEGRERAFVIDEFGESLSLSLLTLPIIRLLEDLMRSNEQIDHLREGGLEIHVGELAQASEEPKALIGRRHAVGAVVPRHRQGTHIPGDV